MEPQKWLILKNLKNVFAGSSNTVTQRVLKRSERDAVTNSSTEILTECICKSIFDCLYLQKPKLLNVIYAKDTFNATLDFGQNCIFDILLSTYFL